MKKDLTELVFILDKSGSMAGLETDTIGGFNGMIERQKKQAGERTTISISSTAMTVLRSLRPIGYSRTGSVATTLC